jgi:hypothetical protein
VRRLKRCAQITRGVRHRCGKRKADTAETADKAHLGAPRREATQQLSSVELCRRGLLPPGASSSFYPAAAQRAPVDLWGEGGGGGTEAWEAGAAALRPHSRLSRWMC